MASRWRGAAVLPADDALVRRFAVPLLARGLGIKVSFYRDRFRVAVDPVRVDNAHRSTPTGHRLVATDVPVRVLLLISGLAATRLRFACNSCNRPSHRYITGPSSDCNDSL